LNADFKQLKKLLVDVFLPSALLLLIIIGVFGVIPFAGELPLLLAWSFS
jgi:ABC-type multidrug transport system permease subunit